MSKLMILFLRAHNNIKTAVFFLFWFFLFYFFCKKIYSLIPIFYSPRRLVNALGQFAPNSLNSCIL